MEKIDNLLSKHTKKQGLYRLAESSRICFIANKLSNDEFTPISFKNGILTVKVENHIIAQKIQLNSTFIISKINYELKNKEVKKIRYVISN